MATFRLEILTPYKTYFSDDISFLRFKNDKSVLGILPHHADIVTSVEICEVMIQKDNESTLFACGGGLFSMNKNSATLLVKSIESKDEIDLERAKSSKQRAEERLNNKNNIDVRRAEASLERALVRISVFEKEI